jgi:hypothetical protein
MENVLQELDAVVKDESAPLPFAISPQKVESGRGQPNQSKKKPWSTPWIKEQQKKSSSK